MKTILSASDRRELLGLFVELEGQSRAGAKRLLADSQEQSLQDALHRLRRVKLERNGQASLSLPSGAAETPVNPPAKTPVSASGGDSKAKKVPYTFLIPPAQLEALNALSEHTDLPVSHHIRQAIRAYLTHRR